MLSERAIDLLESVGRKRSEVFKLLRPADSENDSDFSPVYADRCH